MEAAFNENGQGVHADANIRMTDTGDASLEVRNLMADMQDLLGRVAHIADPEIARLRARVERGLAAAKQTLAEGTDRIQRHAKDAVAAGDGYVREQPWQAVGIGAAAGLVVGFLVARR